MNDVERILKLQQKLRAALAAITEQVELSAQERCPYRDAADLCTFEFGCRNQLRGHEGRKCSGVRLNIQHV